MKVLVFPYDKNPYQTLLYTAMKKTYGKKVTIRYAWFLPIVGALHFPFEIAVRRLLGYRIIHIHWVAFYLRIKIPKHETISYHLTRFNFWWMKALGYKVIWTVHDIVPHQKETIDDLALSRDLARITDLKIIHSQFSKQQLIDKGLDSSNYAVIPHGNYKDVYKDSISRTQARKQLGIGPKKTVFLFFGIVKEYKGIRELLNSYAAVRSADTVLLIAGICSDEQLVADIQVATSYGDIIFHNDYVSDDSVAMYFKAGDFVCLPFRTITTSGSTLLALTFGKPIIAPRSGSLEDIPAKVGYLYGSQDKLGLTNALTKASTHLSDIPAMSRASRSYADTIDWSLIADQTYEAYRKVLA